MGNKLILDKLLLNESQPGSGVSCSLLQPLTSLRGLKTDIRSYHKPLFRFEMREHIMTNVE